MALVYQRATAKLALPRQSCLQNKDLQENYPIDRLNETKVSSSRAFQG